MPIRPGHMGHMNIGDTMDADGQLETPAGRERPARRISMHVASHYMARPSFPTVACLFLSSSPPQPYKARGRTGMIFSASSPFVKKSPYPWTGSSYFPPPLLPCLVPSTLYVLGSITLVLLPGSHLAFLPGSADSNQPTH